MTTYRNLSIGSGGEEVRKLQNALMSAGYDVGARGADGKFGPATQAAVKKYQKDKGLDVDGIVGSKTRGTLYGSDSAASGGNTTERVTSRRSSGVSGVSGGSAAPPSAYDAAGDSAYQQALAALLEAQKNAPQYANNYEGQLRDLYDQIVNREKFRYDVNADALYQQYAQQYAEKGRMAMMDTMGQAAALTGGYASTYGQAVGQQQYDAYLQQLNDVVPELYQMAYDRYQDEGDQMQRQYAMLGDMADDEYNKYRDAYNQWLTERDYAQGNADTAYDRGYNQWLQQMNQYNVDREYQEAVRQFNEQMALQREQFAWQQAQAEAAAAAKSSGGSGSGGSSGGSKGSGKSSGTGSGGYSFGELMDAFASGMSKAQVEAVLKNRGVDISKDTVQADIRKAMSK